MARQPQPDKRPAPRLYLVTPPLGEANAFARELGQAVRAADIAAVLLRLKPAGERELVNRVKALASVVQETGAALVLDGHRRHRGPRRSRWRAPDRHRGIHRRCRRPEAGAHCRLRRSSHARRCDGGGRERRGLRDVRRAGGGRPAAVVCGDPRTHRMVGRACSKSPASALPRRWTRWGRLPRRAPISLLSGKASGTIREVLRLRSRTPRQGLALPEPAP